MSDTLISMIGEMAPSTLIQLMALHVLGFSTSAGSRFIQQFYN